ncbi:hypothetical protein ACFY5F_28375 [Streptomyces sp. NPDC013161]|uniref:hypothetical protein n=1 Tax=Streptomyces sp. NPDC013161 TaxID=3364862 RepID=UPI0036B8EFC8
MSPQAARAIESIQVVPEVAEFTDHLWLRARLRITPELRRDDESGKEPAARRTHVEQTR